MRKLEASSYRSMPWKNGGGTTTEIACWPEGASLESFGWRVSVAQITADGPFSRFDGVDRTIALVSGEGMTLAFDDGARVALTPGAEPYPFAGERAAHGALDRGPVEDFNAMTRRASWRHRMARVALPRAIDWACVADRAVIFVAREAASDLAPRDAVVLDRGESLRLIPRGEAELLVVELWESR